MAHHARRLFLFSAAALLVPLSALAAPTDVPSAASFFVRRMPDLHQDSTHPLHIYSGHISSDPLAASLPATDITAHLFFVMVKNRRSADKERVLFWFNGGPGCSSFDGLMMEIGPWRIDGKGGLKTTEGGWEEYTTLVFVDQPAGTGLSYTSTNKYVHELSEAGQQVVEFLRNFYKTFPEYQFMDTYLAGESYAGQYIPYIADAILNSDVRVPLQGVAIGNGWIDPERQYPAYLDYGVKHGLLEENSAGYTTAKKVVDNCMAEYAKVLGDIVPVNIPMCEGIMSSVSAARTRQVDGKNVCMNVYDIRLDDAQGACGMNWPADLPDISAYLGRKDVVSALHATAKSESWVECNVRVGSQLRNDKSTASIDILPRVLEKIPVMLFAGDQDFICNYMGIESLISHMNWNGAQGLGTVSTKSWSVDGSPAGTWVSSRNLTYVKIFNSSHMAPYDVPQVAHDMILRFMGVNFTSLTGGTARIPSSVGDDKKPVFVEEAAQATTTPAVPPAKTPEQDKAMWEAYYNAGSAALFLVIIAVLIGTFIWCRLRKRRQQSGVSLGTAEESIPLQQNSNDDSTEDLIRRNKGKGRMTGDEEDKEPIFEVGSDDEGGHS